MALISYQAGFFL